jgi:hypothetical protein
MTVPPQQEQRVERRLAAIFAADVAGYSRLMSQDEAGTLRALAAAREIMDGLIAAHGGRIANTAGDSVLAEFPSAVDAVQVVYARFHPSFGNTVVIEHDVSANAGLSTDTVYSLYAHLDKLLVSEGPSPPEVDQGDPIGTLGKTGRGAIDEHGVARPHLHWEIFSADWHTYLSGGFQLYGYAEASQTAQSLWYDPTGFVQDYFLV